MGDVNIVFRVFQNMIAMKKYTYKDLAEGRITIFADDLQKTDLLVRKSFPKDPCKSRCFRHYYRDLHGNGIYWGWNTENINLPIIPASEVSLEDEFVLPEKWCIERTEENFERVNKWFNEKYPEDFGYVDSNCYLHSYNIYGWNCPKSSTKKHADATEITTEQFDKYVLGVELKKEIVLPEKYYVHCETDKEAFEYTSLLGNGMGCVGEGYYGHGVTTTTGAKKLNRNTPIFKFKDIKHLLNMEDKTKSPDLRFSGTFRENKKETREIIGYKCPMDLIIWSMKKGDLFTVYNANSNGYMGKTGSNPILAQEIVEAFFEPVYKEEKTLPVIGGKHYGKSKCDNESGYGVIIYGCQDQIVHTFKEVKEGYEFLKKYHILSFEHASGETVTINEVQQIVEYINSKEK